MAGLHSNRLLRRVQVLKGELDGAMEDRVEALREVCVERGRVERWKERAQNFKDHMDLVLAQRDDIAEKHERLLSARHGCEARVAALEGIVEEEIQSKARRIVRLKESKHVLSGRIDNLIEEYDKLKLDMNIARSNLSHFSRMAGEKLSAQTECIMELEQEVALL